MKKLLVGFLVFMSALSVLPGPKDSDAADAVLTGKVVETMDSSGYTYVCIEKKGQKTWLAVPQTKVTKGKTMSFYSGAEMVNFKSDTLNRTFEKIIFSGGVVSNTPAPTGDSAISGKVVETMDSGGYTYVCLEKKGKKTWVAVPQTKITKGKNMSFYPGSEMVNFKSKTLNRTFEKIIFSGGQINN